MLLDLLDRRERRNAALLLALMLSMGLMEAIGVASVVPFIAVVANPDIVTSNPYLSAVAGFLGISDSRKFLALLGLGAFVVLVVRLAFTAVTQWAMARYSLMRSYTLSSRLLRGYMGRPYTYFLNRHSSNLTRTVLSEVSQVVGKSLMPLLELMANLVVAAFLICLVVAVDPVIALVAVAVLGGGYGIMYLALKGHFTRLGAERVECNRARFRVAQEALGGIKDIKVLGLEEGYLKGFSRPAKRLAKVQARSQVVSELPQLGMRALVFGGMLMLVVGLLVSSDGDLGSVLPIVGLYAYAGTRLIPALQKVYKASMMLRFGKAALDLLYKDMVETGQIGASLKRGEVPEPPSPMVLDAELVLDNVTYTYPEASKPALKNLNLVIPARTTVGIVGSTGAGKTTVVDLILGLLEPDEGRLVVDGTAVDEKSLRAWQCNIGYVPQSIYLSDDTVAANIAFGVPDKKIDSDAVERAARIAELHDFVIDELPEGYETMIGERGVRLSGGQRQRIGIARALYRDPGVLVLDEATSALDNLTEKAVMAAVHNLGHRKTIILIAHRLSTVRRCDSIFLLEHGRLVEQGTYDELVEHNRQFRAMAGLPGGAVGSA